MSEIGLLGYCGGPRATPDPKPLEARDGGATLAEPRPGRAEAAAAIWDWRALRAAKTGNAGALESQARTRGLLRGALVAVVGALVFVFWSRVAGSIALAFSGIVLTSALVSPTGLYAALERALESATRGLGLGLTWVFMSIIFYGVVTPFGLLFRRGSRDPMRRFYEPSAASYWSERTLGRSASKMRGRQF